MKEILFRLSGKKDGRTRRYAFPAYETTTRGIVVHRFPVFTKDGKSMVPKEGRSPWRVSHSSSGLFLKQFSTKKKAFEFASAIGDIGLDWTAGREEMIKGVKEKDRRLIFDIAAAIEGGKS